MFSALEILPTHAKRFVQGHPWVYSNELKPNPSLKTISPGEVVSLACEDQFLAWGYYNRHSLIAFRALSRDKQEKIDREFFIKRLRRAQQLRETFYPQPYYRLIHAESDGLPGLIIDRFDTVFVVQINTQGMEKLQDLVFEALDAVFQAASIYVQYDAGIRNLEGLELRPPVMIGQSLEILTVIENDTQFQIPVSGSQKTGWFYDNRENRKLIASLAKNKTLIDYYCYSGGFALQAAKQGATRVIGVDSAKPAIQNARLAADLNGLSNTSEFIVDEVFKNLDSRLEEKEKFDIVVLDPPAFIKSKKDLGPGLKGYEKLLSKGLSLVKPGGLLAILSCSYHLKAPDLKLCLNRAAFKTKHSIQILHTLQAGFDHPVHPLLEESEYLKGFLVRVF